MCVDVCVYETERDSDREGYLNMTKTCVNTDKISLYGCGKL